MKSEPLKNLLKEAGASVVGVGDVSRALTPEIRHLSRAVAIGINRNLNRGTLRLLTHLQLLTEEWLRDRGSRVLTIPPDSDRQRGKLISRLYKLFCHKTAATCAGLGWIGKNGLLINREFGSKLSWVTVLTDAPLETDSPSEHSECGECELCIQHCPSGALTGKVWSMDEPIQEIVCYEKCRSLKNKRSAIEGKPNCGFCVTVCPYSRSGRTRSDSVPSPAENESIACPS